jgi:PGF-CTERM protein
MRNPTVLDIDVILDTTPPDFVINNPPKDTFYTKESRIEIIGTMVDREAHILILDREVEHIGVFKAWVELEEGGNLIEVKAIDQAGNEKVVALTIIRDSVPPALVMNIPSGSSLITNFSMVNLWGTTDDGIDRVMVNGVEEAVRDGNFSIDLELDEGQNTIVVSVVDKAGNVATSTIEYILDTVAPTFTLDYPNETDRSIVVISGTCDSSVGSIRIHWQPVQIENGTFRAEVTLQEDGENLVNITFSDRAGNTVTEFITILKDTETDTETETPGFGAGLAILGITIAILGIRRSRLES